MLPEKNVCRRLLIGHVTLDKAPTWLSVWLHGSRLSQLVFQVFLILVKAAGWMRLRVLQTID